MCQGGACLPISTGSTGQKDGGAGDGGTRDGGAGDGGTADAGTGDGGTVDAGSCQPGQTACIGQCVDVLTDAAHCGACNNPCPGTQSCRAGVCTDLPADCRQAACPGGYYCDLGSGECHPGCAADTQCPQPGTCDLGTHSCRCASAHLMCGGTCAACSTPPNAVAHCSGTSCDFTCNAGYHRCGSQCLPDNSPSSCGSSCTPCPVPPNATATCDGTSCGFTCNAGYHRCGNSCVSNQSVSSCGTSCSPCAPPANATATCNGASCGFSCSPGYHACGSQCSSNTSVSSCGTSCTPCPVPANGTATCDGTTCGFTCNAGYVPSGSACVQRCETAGCTGFTWCNTASGLCESGCATHTQCTSSQFCALSSHTCAAPVVPSGTQCTAAYNRTYCYASYLDYCIHKQLPSGVLLNQSTCPTGTYQRGTYTNCSGYTVKVCFPN